MYLLFSYIDFAIFRDYYAFLSKPIIKEYYNGETWTVLEETV